MTICARVAVLVTSALAVVPITGCTPRVVGVMAVALSPGGEVLAYANTCDKNHRWEDARLSADQQEIRTWNGPRTDGAFLHWTPAAAAPESWRTSAGTNAPLQSGVTYRLEIVETSEVRRSDYARADLTFTLDDLAHLPPGQAWAGRTMRRDGVYERTFPMTDVISGEACKHRLDYQLTTPSPSPGATPGRGSGTPSPGATPS